MDSVETPSVGQPTQIRLSELGQAFGFRCYHVLVTLAVVFTAVGNSVVSATGPYVQEAVINEAGIDEASGSLFSTSVLAGSIFGVIGWGGISDRIGRRRSMLICTAALMTLNLSQLLVPSGRAGFVRLVILRCCIGLFYGGLLTLPLTYIAETSGDTYRGSLMVATALGSNIGSVYSILFIMQHARQKQVQWNVIVSLAPLLPCSLALLGLLLCPESPRWLFMSGQKDRAQKVVNRILESQPLLGEAVVGHAPEVISDAPNAEKSLWEDMQCLFSPALRRITIVCTLLYFVFASASNAAWTFGPKILGDIAEKKSQDLTPFLKAELAGLAGTALSALSVDWIGRKLLMGLCLMMKVAFFWLLLLPTFTGYYTQIWAMLTAVDGAFGQSFPPSFVRFSQQSFAALVQVSASSGDVLAVSSSLFFLGCFSARGPHTQRSLCSKWVMLSDFYLLQQSPARRVNKVSLTPADQL
eukprot:CAMPEP_0197660322 /NCGR_PEP_ID=MMETSP1338-20131121/50779_1 /TAXON_ID=43686 ORGANISM="Pelagodinium beii, Strain RCC1491" /NCGR_SAMPLE_ID=MMETSP1338 /ASSEMBLY_ACC=CAM_ASM_000754 /LENGTH=469 /DNA_ID=CAMNT_0043237655 /DNA_START=116 /DNA_END=1526 /DNA_ORIENTATION=+